MNIRTEVWMQLIHYFKNEETKYTNDYHQHLTLYIFIHM